MTVHFTPEKYVYSNHELREVIFNEVIEVFGIPRKDLESPNRSRNIVRPRQVAMYLMRRHTSISYPNIGKAFGDRDHTTAMHAYETIDRLIKVDPNLAKSIENIESRLPRKIVRAGEDVGRDVGYWRMKEPLAVRASNVVQTPALAFAIGQR